VDSPARPVPRRFRPTCRTQPVSTPTPNPPRPIERSFECPGLGRVAPDSSAVGGRALPGSGVPPPSRRASRLPTPDGDRMKLAFSTNAYLRFPFDEAARRIAACGYRGLELMADVPHAWPAGLLEGPKREIRAAMASQGLAFSNVNAFMMNAI